MGTRRGIVATLPLILGFATFTGSQGELSASKEQPGLSVIGASTVGFAGWLPGQGPLLATAVLVPGRTQLEIKKLITELGDDNFQVREKATKRLAEIGVPALDALREAEEKGDAETKRRAGLLIESISIANRLPSKVKGMEFKLITDKEWAAPKPGEKTTITVRLQVTNTTDTVYRLYLAPRDAVMKVVLKDSTGKDFSTPGGVERKMKAARFSPPLKKNQSYTMSLEAKLIPSGDKYLFFCQDVFSQFWQVDGLSKGTYSFGLVYVNDKQAADGGDPFWAGRMETQMETVVIK